MLKVVTIKHLSTCTLCGKHLEIGEKAIYTNHSIYCLKHEASYLVKDGPVLTDSA